METEASLPSISSEFSSSEEEGEAAEGKKQEIKEQEVLVDEGPKYTKEQLQSLVEKVKAFTVLYGLSASNWSEEVYSVIEKFFTEKSEDVLSIYFHGTTLCASLGYPNFRVRDLTYFVKDTASEISPENFFESVTFGTINNGIELSMLNIVGKIYAPPFFTATAWPDNVKWQFYSHLHAFLADLTELHYKMMGLTVIYIPTEGSDIDVETASKDKELIKRLEGVVMHWSRQIRVALGDQNQVSPTEQLCPKDEFQFWIYRYKNLLGLDYQLQNKNVKHTIEILMTSQCTYISQFVSVMGEITKAIMEAKSNIEFLQILNKPCEELDELDSPGLVPLHLPHILNLIRVIWMRSPFYNTRGKITGLCRALSNQIIIKCQRSVNLDEIFSGYTRKGIKTLEACISCCVKYRFIYEKIAEAHTEYSKCQWDLDKASIFNHVDSFTQRCRDMVEVCEAMRVFGRMDETEVIPRPMFGGTEGPEFEATCDKVESTFRCSLQAIQDVKHTILEVQATSWYSDIIRFRNQVKELEVILENLVIKVFETIKNVEEGIEALQGFYHYYKRPALKQLFEKKTAEVYNLFVDDMLVAKKRMVSNEYNIPACYAYFSGRAMMYRMTKKRLDRLMKLLDDAEWMIPCAIGEKTHSQYESIVKWTENQVKDLYHKWIDTLDEDVNARLCRPLMCHSLINPGLIECNFDGKLINICHEASYWELMKFPVPSHITKIYNKWHDLKILYESIVTIAQGFNKIVTSLSDSERLLFRESIKACNKKIKPGLTSLKWNSDVSDMYISECLTCITELQDFVDDFKKSNLEIVRICEKVCDSPLILIEPMRSFELPELKDHLNHYRDGVIQVISSYYQEIMQYLKIVYEGFGEHIEMMEAQWSNYVLRMDSMFEEALQLCIKNSLGVMYVILHGDGTIGPQPLIKVDAILMDKKITFDPSVNSISRLFKNVLRSLVDSLACFLRLYEKWNITCQDKLPYHVVIQQNEECLKLQAQLNQEVETNINHLYEYVNHWNVYKSVWSLDKDLFISHYENDKRSAEAFDADISRYTEIANNVQMEDTISFVYFSEVNAAAVKKSIIMHCVEWQKKLTELLCRTTNDMILDFYKYMEDYSKKLMHEPQDLDELDNAMRLHGRLTEEVQSKEKEFPVINTRFQILERHEADIPLEMNNGIKFLPSAWEQYCELLYGEATDLVERNKERFRSNLLDTAQTFQKNATQLLDTFLTTGPFTSACNAKDALALLRTIREGLENLRATETQLKTDLGMFKISLLDTPELATLEKELAAIEVVWELTNQWDEAWESYKSGSFWTIEAEEMENTAQTLFRKLTRLSRELRDKNWEIVENTRQRVDAFRRTLPLLSDLKNPAMRKRHWDSVKKIMGVDFDQNSPDFTLDVIMELKFQNYAEHINEISNAAAMELSIETGLKQITEIWRTMELDMVPHKDKGVFRLKSIDEVGQALEENQVALSAMKSTRFVEAFAKEVDYWERTLSLIMETLELVLLVQRQWLYLENIFSGEDIRKQLPKETDEYDKATNIWKDLMFKMYKEKNALRATTEKGVWDKLTDLNTRLEAIQRALEKYLETKRHIFPRFYFISNDDLLEILAQARRPEAIQPHLKKCFDNINKIKIQKLSVASKYEALGMFSADGEYVEFTQILVLDGPVELWLCELERTMRCTLRIQLKNCRASLRKNLTKRDVWIKDWPGQMCITSSQIQWTTDCTRTLMYCKVLETRSPLKKLRRKQNQVLGKFSDAIRGSLTKIQRLKVVALVTIEIHARDVIDKMYRSNCMDVTAFEWLSQLRFYWDREIDDCIIRQTNTYFNYGYEYLGNSGRLVITPLTDRCYITLTTALHLHRGGSPKGPAGTGKTETVKDLGKGLGSYVIVVNCSEGLDYRSMGRMFSGLAQTGAWGCFDEFNRINIEVLSVVAQQILSILSSLSQGAKRFVFEGCDISLVKTCGIFITMNPGYAGRTELPDNLKSMFRPISMIVPDSAMIAEIILFGEGFRETRILAKKVYTLYSLAMQQLSKQDHYDFGLRSMVALLRYAGRKRRGFPDLPDEEVVLLAMKDMNNAKLTSDDLPLFNGITSDLFPQVEVPVLEYDELTAAIKAELKAECLQIINCSIVKIIQLYETKNSRHSTMIVGKTGAGKSATWRMLQASLSRLRKEEKPGYNLVKTFPINPKALTLGELYGEFNLATNEWLDGVLSSIMRVTCSDELPDEKWIVFDGPVDAVWIENMNSVMDDNKVLTLINSERITMPEQVSLLFEVEDLAVASPATVSRCGMVYNDYKDLGWWPYVNSWLQKQPSEDYQNEMRSYFERYGTLILDYKRLNCVETVPISDFNAMTSLCKLLECLATKENGINPADEDNFPLMVKLWFLFCMIWSLCASVDEDGRKKLDTLIRGMEGCFPLKDTIYEYYVDVRSRNFACWEVMLTGNWKFDKELPFFKIIVPTVDTVRYQFLVSVLLSNSYPGLLVGPVGTGKTSTAQTVLDSLDRLKFSLLVLNMSAQTTSQNVQDTIEGRVEKRTKDIYVPVGGKIMITFMDDLNMPAKEEYGSQPPLELIRQWIDYGFWYDRQKQKKKYIKDMQLMAAMGPPGGGRNTISNRLMSRFNIINMTFPSTPQIIRIYGSMLTQQLSDFDEEPKYIAHEITLATIDLYNAVCSKMLPTPTKIHYLFNLRDISKVFQGLLRSHREYHYTKNRMLRLWVHECYRVFNDRLVDEKDIEWFFNQMNDQLGKHFDLTFSSVCPEKESPIFADFISSYGFYEDITDLAALRRHLEGQIEEYNVTPGVARVDLVLFKFAIQHICRIVRVISQPRGNMLLVGIGGSGRQSLSRVAAYICEYQTFQIEVTKQYRVQEFREDLKTLYTVTGVENKATTFLFNDTQIADEAFVEVINNVLSSGEVPNLFKAEEFDEIRNKLSATAAKEGVSPTTEAMYNYLIARTRANLHIVLCLSPIGDAFRNRLRQYPALINCTTIDWFLEWPQEALLEVASKYLGTVNFLENIKTMGSEEQVKMDKDMLEEQERLRDAVARIFATIHDSVSKWSKKMLIEMKRHNYVTPTNYLELVAGYISMLHEKRWETANAANKLRNGLFKIDDTREKVQLMSVELEESQVKVVEFQQQCDEYLVTIMTQKREADEQQKSVAAKSLRIGEEEAACKKLADVAQADLNQAMPALEEAMRALDALNKRDLTEVKSYGRPPARVEMVMEAVMILKQVEPTWAEAKRQLGDANFLNQLKDFDKDNISDKTLKKIAEYTRNDEFEPEKVGIVSFAAKSLCLWVIAIEKYGKIYRVVAPKKAKLEEAMKTLQEKQDELQAAENKLRKISEQLEKLRLEYEDKMKQKEELRQKSEDLQQKLERATMLVEGLAGEKVRWEQTVKLLDGEFNCLPGNVLIATAFVSYLGPFVSQYRDQLITMWKKAVVKDEIPVSNVFSITTFLADPTMIREWNIQGLPSDEFSTENGIIVTRATRWPLLIDPQCQGMKWIKNMEGKNDLKVIDFGQADFMKTLEQAMQFGKPVLLQNVLEVLDPSLQPILNKAIIIQGGQMLIKLFDRLVQFSPEFRFFITTKLGNPHFAPEISTKTTPVNFAVKEVGLEAQLLGIVVRKEKPKLEEQKDNLVLNIAAGRRTLKDLEDELLRLLYETKGSLLDDLQLLITLQTSQATSVSVNEQLKVAETTETEIDAAREGYRPCARRASILFFVLNDMSQIDPMYQFSLDAYTSLFTMSIEKSKKSEDLEQRISFLNDYHTYAVYRNTCRGLFERHKLLFSFHMCMKILEAMGKVNSSEYNFLLRGGVVLDRDEQLDNPCPGWLSDQAWDNITELDKLGGFHGVADSFEQYPKDWQVWYTQKEPEDQPLIGDWEGVCTKFQRMLFVRSLRPDRMSFCVSAFVVNTLGQRFVEPPVLDIKSVLADSTPMTPLIFVLSPGVDPTGSLIQLAESTGMSARFQSLSLGQGQAPIATRLIKVGAREGHWVFLANCHLSLSWMPKLDKIIELLQTGKAHEDFRLWLSSSPHPDFPISILQAGIKMTTEPPKGLKANLKRLYQLITPTQFSICKNQTKYRRLLFSLCFFHSILLERKKFQQLGWNVVYSFNDSDFEVSENLLQIYLDEYPETPWDALKYLIAGVNYGGHVTDDWDRRLLTTYINRYFNEDVLTNDLYRLSSLPTYVIPRDGSLQSYQDYIALLPNVDQPEAFGQHSNADITSLISETRSMFETLMSMQVQVAAGEGESKEEKVLQLAADVLSKVPNPIDYEATDKLIGAEKTPLDVVLLQEISRYNVLLVSIRQSLEDLQKGIQGLVVMSATLEDIFVCIYEGRVPTEWLKAYPSLKLLGSWSRDLVLRVEHFAQWAETTHPPVLFWLAAYTFPTGFLTAVLQTSARRSNVSIDSLSWDFTIFAPDERSGLQPPADGVYVRSVYLEGAGWDWRKMCLIEPQPMQLVCPMPVIHFKPMEHLKKKSRGIYVCPCYYYPIRCGGGGRESFVVAVDLKSGTENADHWIKRGTALLLSLAN
ncbi:dynein axonemal heavy chain 2 [Schistocerca cancellata]|uniref:dynein axonemal heavy chain 2 n=1 Tax=Schistocerca cancellata TaxID=274614 RepID=UPI0021189156|nr:dynein axonemal heavy chain 2 [Schistocerca cancellata]